MNATPPQPQLRCLYPLRVFALDDVRLEARCYGRSAAPHRLLWMYRGQSVDSLRALRKAMQAQCAPNTLPLQLVVWCTYRAQHYAVPWQVFAREAAFLENYASVAVARCCTEAHRWQAPPPPTPPPAAADDAVYVYASDSSSSDAPAPKTRRASRARPARIVLSSSSSSSESESDSSSDNDAPPRTRMQRLRRAHTARQRRRAETNTELQPPAKRARLAPAPDRFGGACRDCCSAPALARRDALLRQTPRDTSALMLLHYRLGAGECGICMRDDGDDDALLALWHPAERRVCSLADLPACCDAQPARLPDDILLANPCRNATHLVCVRCVRHVLLDRARPPIDAQHAVVHCISVAAHATGRRCEAAYETRWFTRWVLDSAVHVRYLDALAQRHRFPGFEVLRCPLRVIRSGVCVGRCGAECLVPLEQVRAAEQTSGAPPVVVRCTQTRMCNGAFCYRCKMRVRPGASVCTSCAVGDEHTRPDAYNRYVRRATACVAYAADPHAHLLRNAQLDADSVYAQLCVLLDTARLERGRLAIECTRCGARLHKSTQCNALRHCGVEHCYVCGRVTAHGAHLEPSHWDASGARGCPRYDSNAYWRAGAVPFLCTEQHCYDDARECTLAPHQAGIDAMHAERRIRHVRALVRSLPAALRAQVLARLPSLRDAYPSV